MKSRSHRWLGGQLAALVAAAWLAGAARGDLPPEVVKRVQLAALDLVRGRAGDAHEKLQPLLELGAAPQQQEIDAVLKRYHIDTALGPLVADLRIDAILGAGLKPGKALKQMGPVEAGFVQAAVEKRLDGLLEPVDKELAIGFRVDAALDALQEQLEHCAGLLDQMDQIDRLQALQSDANRLARGNRRKDALKKEKDPVSNKSRRDQLLSRVVELALAIIPDQMQVLANDGAAYPERIKATARIEDGFAITKYYFPKYKALKKTTGKSVGGKTVGQQDANLKEMDREFDKLAGPLRLKVYHFEQGKMWWLRARWGVGPYHDGETKAVAGRPTLDSFLFYPLVMPDPIPRPLDPLKDARPLPVGRRHLEVWKAAYPAGQAYARAQRNFRISNQVWKLMLPPPGQTSPQYARVVESDDDFNPFVGYLEYQMALFHWGKLLQLANDSELKGLEKSVAEDDRFIVPSYLSRQYDNLDPRSTLKLSPPKSDDPKAKDVYERRGLSWCIALAQIEVAGVRSVYTGLENEPKAVGDAPADMTDPILANPRAFPATPIRYPRRVRPFDHVQPTPFTKTALAELLWDGMRQQYYRVKSEVVFDSTGISLPGEFLPPVVRLAVALEFVRAYRQKFAGVLTAAQGEELRAWQTDLERRLSILVGAWSNALRWAVNAQIQRNIDIGSTTGTGPATGTGVPGATTPPGTMKGPPGGTKGPPGGTTTPPGKGGKSVPAGPPGSDPKKGDKG